MKLNAILIRLVFMGGGVLSAMLVFELVLRLHLLDTRPMRSDRPRRYYAPDNGHSYRDFAYTPAKPAGTYRIVIIGDSFTFGAGVQFDDTFPKRLERLLRMSVSARPVEVINYSMSGYSTVDELRLLKNALENFSPDMILLEITLNDPELEPYKPAHKEDFRSLLEGSLLRHWRGLSFIADRIHNTITNRRHDRYYFDLFEEPQTWMRFSTALLRFKELCDTSKVPLRAVLFPLFNKPLNSSYPFKPLHSKIHTALRQYGVPLLDLFAVYSEMNYERLEIEPGIDGHPNEIAHRIAAEAIFRWLKKTRALPADLLKIRSGTERKTVNALGIGPTRRDLALRRM